MMLKKHMSSLFISNNPRSLYKKLMNIKVSLKRRFNSARYTFLGILMKSYIFFKMQVSKINSDDINQIK